jgi:hypothetical protein
MPVMSMTRPSARGESTSDTLLLKASSLLSSSSLGGAAQGEGREVTSSDILLLKASLLSASSLGGAAHGAGTEATALHFGWGAWHMRQGPGLLPSSLKVHSPQIQAHGAMAI